MKKIFLGLFISLITINAFSQVGSFEGIWLGKINVGVELRIVFHFTRNADGSLNAMIDSPDQSAYGIKCDTATITGNEIYVNIKAIRGSYTGTLLNDSTIEGNFKQGTEYSLQLKKIESPIILKRPQEPKPPYPYKVEEVEFDNADQTIHFGGTLTIPEGKGPFPAVVLISGSGQQNRNEELMGHKPFLLLADVLTRNGIMVLRVDDRGIGKSTGKFNDATTADFANDVSNSVDYLTNRPEADKKKLGLIGHSEGGMIAPMVATSRKDIAFLILLAGPGIKIDQLMAEQNAAILKSSGISQKSLDAYIPVYKKLMQIMVSDTDSLKVVRESLALLDKWKLTTDSSIVRELGLANIAAERNMVSTMVKVINGKWFKYFIAFDPEPYLKQLTGKVLALNGDKDIQVIAGPNLAGIEAALKKSKVKSYAVKSMPGLNHLFQTCNSCTIEEYSQIEETFAPAALKVITDWINKEVK